MIDTVSTTFGAIPDPRRPDRVDSSLHDTLLSGCAMMVFQHPSLLAFQRTMQQRRGRCNLATIFGVRQVHSDTPMRDLLDGVPVALRRPLRPTFFEKWRRAGWAKEFQRHLGSGPHQGDSDTLALDASDDFHSTTVEGPSCVQRHEAEGPGPFRPPVVAATLVTAGSHRV